MLRSEAQIKEVPLKIVGGNLFGRYSKISIEETFNCIVSDDALVPFAGYKNVAELLPTSLGVTQGRSIYSSTKTNKMVAIVDSSVFLIDKFLSKTFVGALESSSGDVFIAENNTNQIAISDGTNIYIYNYLTNVFSTSNVTPGFSIDFIPGMITFQNGRFICASVKNNTTGLTNQWRLSDVGEGLSWPNDAQHVGSLQTKPDTVVGALRFPGAGNLLHIFGHNVTEIWNDQPTSALFPYVKMTSANIDYGCLNPQTIAGNEDIAVWLTTNEQSGPAIMYSHGTDSKKISTDGIDFKLSQLTHPEISYGYFFRQDGHLLYVIVFPDPADNLSYAYDFNTKKFFTITDEDLNHFTAKNVVFFNNTYYFVSFNDGNLYELSTKYSTYQYSDTDIKDIPRIRIMPPLRLPNQRPFIGRSLGFTIENGLPNTITDVIVPNLPFDGITLTTEDSVLLSTEDGIKIAEELNTNFTIIQLASLGVDLSISRDGGVSFGSSLRQNMNPTGKRKSRFIYQRLGFVNDATWQLRFWGNQRFVAMDGVVEVYQ